MTETNVAYPAQLLTELKLAQCFGLNIFTRTFSCNSGYNLDRLVFGTYWFYLGQLCCSWDTLAVIWSIYSLYFGKRCISIRLFILPAGDFESFGVFVIVKTAAP